MSRHFCFRWKCIHRLRSENNGLRREIALTAAAMAGRATDEKKVDDFRLN